MEEAKNEKLVAFVSSVEALDDALNGLFEIFEQTIHTYEQALKSHSKNDIEDALEDVMFAQYEYMRSKFDCLWYEDVILERILRKYAPNVSIFGAFDFELLIQALLYVLQDRYYAITSTSHDGGIDLEAREPFYFGHNAVAFATYYVQCKLYRGSVPVSHVRDFFGVITNDAAEGYFFTTGNISHTGKQFVNRANKSPYSNSLHLVTKDNLQQLLVIGDEIMLITRQLTEIDYGTEEGHKTFDAMYDKIEKAKAVGIELLKAQLPANVQRKLFE